MTLVDTHPRAPPILLRWTFTGRDFIPLNTPVERAAT